MKILVRIVKQMDELVAELLAYRSVRKAKRILRPDPDIAPSIPLEPIDENRKRTVAPVDASVDDKKMRADVYVEAVCKVRPSPYKVSEYFTITDTVLGSGSFGEVLLCTRDGKRYAVKRGKFTDKTNTEAAFQKLFSDKGIGPPVPEEFFFVDNDNQHAYIVMEAMDGSVDRYIRRGLNHREWKDLESAIRTLLSKQRAYSVLCVDQKPENMLFKRTDHGVQIYLSDFGAEHCCVTENLASCPSTQQCGDLKKFFYLVQVQVAVLCRLNDPEHRPIMQTECTTNLVDYPKVKYNNMLVSTFLHYMYHIQTEHIKRAFGLWALLQTSKDPYLVNLASSSQDILENLNTMNLSRAIHLLHVFWVKEMSQDAYFSFYPTMRKMRNSTGTQFISAKEEPGDSSSDVFVTAPMMSSINERRASF